MRKMLVALAPLTLLLAACGDGGGAQSEAADPAPSPSQSSEDSIEAAADATEQAAAQTRLALTYDGGVIVVNAEDFDVIADIPLDGFNRLNPTGDGRTMAVSTTGGFQVLDMGTWAQAHGDHSHYFTADPALTDVKYRASEPGHVVNDEGITTLFDDGTGTVYVVPTNEVAAQTGVEEITLEPHHGVAVPFDDNLLVTTADRKGVQVLNQAREVTAESNECPNIHGEGVVDDSVVFGCSDGALVFHEGHFKKLTSPDANGRLGTLLVSPESDVVLSNYTPNYDGDAREAEITTVALVDTETSRITSVDLGTGYSFRSLARGDHGEALVLGADGKIHVIDPETGDETAAYPVIDPWTVPADWQAPRPAIFVADGTAYVSDPAAKKIFAVDIETGEVWLSGDLPHEVNELSGVTGFASFSEDDHGDHDGHDHEGHDHGDDENHEAH